MARRTIIMTETFAEKQARTRRETVQRMRFLAVVAVLSIIARVVVKDPVRPPPPDHSGTPIKLMPGLLASLPPSERAKLSPQLIAQMMLVDEEAKLARARQTKEKSTVELAYRHPTKPEEEDLTGERAKQQQFQIARRRHASDVVHLKLKHDADAPKKTLVRFARGGTLRVEGTRRGPEGLTLRMAGVSATFPERMIGSISTNPADWQEPIPAGKVLVQPAPGITIIVGRDTARRISISKSTYDEI